MNDKEQLERDAVTRASEVFKDPAALERAARALASGDAELQELAVRICNRLHGRGRWSDSAQADLVRALGAEQSPAVRDAALTSLRRCASASLAGTALRGMILHEDAQLRERARSVLHALARASLDWSDAVRSWAEESEGTARAAALDAYRAHHSLEAGGWTWITPWLDADDERVRVAAAGAIADSLGLVGRSRRELGPQHPRFLPSLMQVLRDHPNEFRRLAAAECLASQVQPDVMQQLLRAAADDRYEPVRHAALVALESHPVTFDAAREIVLRTLVLARESDRSRHSSSSFEALSLLHPHEEAVPFVIGALAREPDPESTMTMLGWLGQRSCAASFDVITEWLRLSPEQLEARCGTSAARHREAAIRAVAARRRDAQFLVPELLALLSAPPRDNSDLDQVTGLQHDARIEFTVVEALVAIGVTSAEIRVALGSLHARGLTYLSRVVVGALGTLGADDDVTVDAILDGLESSESHTVDVARDALIKLGALLVPRLEQRRDDPARSEVASQALALITVSPETVDDPLGTQPDRAQHAADLRDELRRSGSSHALTLALLAPSGADNAVVSPLSIALVLHLLRDAASEAKRAELPAWLHEGAEHAVVMHAVARLRAESVPEFHAAMGLFVDPEAPLVPAFEQRFAGHLERVQLDGRDGVRRINTWAHEQSQGLVPDLVAELPALTRLVLVQLTRFSGRWVTPLDFGAPGATMSFHTARRAWRAVACMSGIVDCLAAQTPDYDAVELPYEPGTTALLLLIPKEGTFLRFRSQLDATGLDQIVSSLADDVVSLQMPRFAVEAELGGPALQAALGLDGLMDAPDLSGMTGRREADARLVLRHVARLRAHELGTDAVAATTTFLIGCSARRVTVDRPFLFFLRHRETGVVLFAGQVTDPVDA